MEHLISSFMGKPVEYWAELQGVADEKAVDKYILRLASARAIMQKFVDKVDRGMARSVETYAEMKEWLDD